MVGLCDCNSFYASCEQLFRPDLRESPIVVLSNNDGIVVALNRKAKDMGLVRGDAWFKVSEDAERRGCVAFSSNYELYQSLSDKVMTELAEETGETEIYSIDEAFFNADGIKDPAALRNRIIRNTGIPVSVGIARTKTLSKIANHIGKKLPSGAYTLTPENETEVLRTLPVSEIWGVGPRLTKRLFDKGIRYALTLRNTSDDFILKYFNVTLLRTVYELRGMETDHTEDTMVSMQSGISFSHPISDETELRRALAVQAGVLSQKLTAADRMASVFGINISTSRFKENYESPYVSVKLTRPTSYLPILQDVISAVFDRVYHEGAFYTSCRCFAMDLVKLEDRQGGLFYDNERVKREERLSSCFRELTERYGRSALQTASYLGLEKKDLTKRERKSPSYTTRFEELPPVW